MFLVSHLFQWQNLKNLADLPVTQAGFFIKIATAAFVAAVAH